MKKIFILAFINCICFFGFSQKNKECTIAFYNIENLYDTINDPDVDDEEFLPGGKNNWTGERFEKKIYNLAKVIDSLGGGPSILGLSEVENRFVLETLVAHKKIAKKDYGIVHENSIDKRGIDVAMIYKKSDFKPLFHKMARVSLPDDPEFITRDIMIVKGLLFSKPVYFFINHWPSRRGGDVESRPKRIAAAKVARYSIDTILKSDPKANIILMGDFNDSPTDQSIVEYLGAADSPDAKGLVLFDAMASLAKAGDGSHSYKEEWNMLDQIIVSKNLLESKSKLQYELNSAAVYRPLWMHDKYSKHKGAPYRTYAGPKFIGGYSDHFPVYIKLKM